MSDDAPRRGWTGKPKNSGWRGQKPPAPQPTKSRRWLPGQSGAEAKANRANAYRRLKATVFTLLVTALIGVFVWYVINFPVKTPLIVAAVTRYEAPLPLNAWAREDIERFARAWPAETADGGGAGSAMLGLFQRDSKSVRVINTGDEWTDEGTALRELEERLRTARPGGPNKDVVLLYISAHAMLDDAGKPSLVLSRPAQIEDSSAGLVLEPARWLTIENLLARIARINRPKAVKTVLFLDCNRFQSSWALGVFYNQLVQQIRDSLEDSDLHQLAIITAADDGQTAWAQADLKGSAFAAYLIRGLYGAADRQPGIRPDQFVSLRELADYLRQQVARWSSERRDQLQTPVLLLSEDLKDQDFPLAWVDKLAAADEQTFATLADQSSPAVEAGAGSDASAEPQDLSELWKLHEQLNPWKEGQPVRPTTRDRWLAWEAFQAGLVRCDEMLLAGKAYQQDAADLRLQLAGLARTLSQHTVSPDVAAYSLPLLWNWTGQKPAEPLRAMIQRRFFEAGEPALSTFDYSHRAWAAWQWALTKLQFTGEQGSKTAGSPLDKVLAGVGRPLDAQGPELLEMRLLRLLAWLPNDVRGDPLLVQDALKCRDLAEQVAGATADERTHYAVRALLESADDARRKADDKLFLGRTPAVQADTAARKHSVQVYRQADYIAQVLRRAYEARDRAFSELPHLARWLVDDANFEPDDADSAAGLDRCRLAIQRVGQLATLIESYVERSMTATPVELEGLEAAAKQLERDRQELASLFDGAVVVQKNLRAADVKNLRALGGLLRCPLLTGNRRAEIRNKYLQILQAGAHEPTATAAVDVDEAAVAAQRRQFLLRLAGKPYPAAALLAGAHPAPASAEQKAASQESTTSAAGDKKDASQKESENERAVASRLLAEGRQVRDVLRRLPMELRNWMQQPDADPDHLRPPLAVARAALSRADRAARVALPFVSLGIRMDSPGFVIFDAQRQLRDFDLHHFQTWHASRVLDDYWGAAGGDRAEPYFAAVGQRYCAQAGAFFPRDSAQLQEQQRRLTKYVNCEGKWVQLASERALPGQSDAEGQNYQLTIGVQFAPGMPPGEASLYITDSEGQPVRIREVNDDPFVGRLGIATAGPQKAKQDCMIQAPPKLSSKEGKWQLTSFYRGHLKTEPVDIVPQTKARQVVFKRPALKTPRVTVAGSESDPGYITFVLDCSGSMDEKTASGRSRMKEAKAALLGILESLAAQEKYRTYRASLWLYGHRAGVDSSGNVSWNPGWGPPITGVLPSDDVERVWPRTGEPQVLDSRSVEQPRALLNDARVGAWGRTPLYLAICRAINDDLALRRDQGLPRRLVVITDGANMVHAEGADHFKPNPQNMRKVQDVVDAIARDSRGFAPNAIQLTMIGCDLGNAAKQELSVISRQVSVTFEDVRSEDLLLTLKRSLGLYDYEVCDEAERPAGPQKRVNEYIDVDTHPAHFGQRAWRRYFARLVEEPKVLSWFGLEGGENLRLMLATGSDGKLHLAHSRFKHSGEIQAEAGKIFNLQPNPADPDFNPPEFYAAAATPRISGHDVVFPLSIQNGDPERFSARPAEIWAEITPMSSRANDDPVRLPAYVFHDVGFEPDYPVPVIHFPAADWPAGADSAEIQLWFKLRGHETEPLNRKLVRQVRGLNAQPNSELDTKLAGGKAVRYAVQASRVAGNSNGCQITLTETHAIDDADLYASKVELFPPADEVRHDYFLGGGLAQHAFIYRTASLEEAEDFEIRVYSRDARQRDATKPRRPFKVNLLRRN